MALRIQLRADGTSRVINSKNEPQDTLKDDAGKNVEGVKEGSMVGFDGKTYQVGALGPAQHDENLQEVHEAALTVPVTGKTPAPTK